MGGCFLVTPYCGSEGLRGGLSRTEVKGDPWSAEHHKYMAPWHRSGTGRLATQDKMSFERIAASIHPWCTIDAGDLKEVKGFQFR